MIAKEVWEQFVMQVKADKRFNVGVGIDAQGEPTYIEIFCLDEHFTPAMVSLMVHDMLGPEAQTEILPGLKHTVHVKATVDG